MAHDLKLALYKIGIKYYKKREYLLYQDVFNKISKEPQKKDKYQEFCKLYLESFNGAFKSADQTKSIALIKSAIRSNQDIIYGSVIGGLTNIEMDVYKSDNVNEAVKKIEKDNIAALPYFFMLWTPPDSNIGILLFQYYSSASIFTAFHDNLADFFATNYGFTFKAFPFVPERIQEEFLKKSLVKKIAIIKKKVDVTARKKFSPIIAEEDEISIRLEISNLKKEPGILRSTLQNLGKQAKSLFDANLKDIGIHNNKNDFEMRIYYENSSGKKTYATLARNFEIMPTIDIDSKYKEVGKDYPNYEKITDYCFNLLQDLKELPDFNE